MITNINFPEGTVVKLNRGSFLDQFPSNMTIPLESWPRLYESADIYSGRFFTSVKNYYWAFKNSRIYFRYIPADAISIERCFNEGYVGYDYTFNNTNVLRFESFASSAKDIVKFLTITAGKAYFNYAFEYAPGLRFLTLNVDTSDQTSMRIYAPNSLRALLGTVSLKSMENISQYEITGYNQMNNLREVVLRDLGTKSSQTSVSFAYWPVWGSNSPAQPDAKKSLIDTLITYSFDRAAAGYSNCDITLHSNTKALLTEEEIAQITAKGYTIS